MPLGCPSVARWRSHRRLRNGLCEPSIGPPRTSRLRTIEGSRPTFRSLRSAATDGHPRFPQARASHSQRRRLEVDKHSLHQRSRPQARPIKSRRTKSVQIGSDRHEPSMSLGCPSVARRRSRRRLRNGLHEPSFRPQSTSDLRYIEDSDPVFRSLRCAATAKNRHPHHRSPPQRRPQIKRATARSASQ